MSFALADIVEDFVLAHATATEIEHFTVVGAGR